MLNYVLNKIGYATDIVTVLQEMMKKIVLQFHIFNKKITILPIIRKVIVLFTSLIFYYNNLIKIYAILYVFNAGIITVQRSGIWGKLCYENEKNESKEYTLEKLSELGKAVCKTMTFK